MISMLSQKMKSQGLKRGLLIKTEDYIDKNKFMIWFYENGIVSDKSIALTEDFVENDKYQALIPCNKTIDKLKEIKYNKLIPYIEEKDFKIKVNIIDFTFESLEVDDETMKKIEKIAIKNFDTVRTLKTRQINDLNFHEISIWKLKKSLLECYNLGLNSQAEKNKKDCD
jgi:hypothetical protein